MPSFPCPLSLAALGRGHVAGAFPCRYLDLRSGQYALSGEGGPVRADGREDGRVYPGPARLRPGDRAGNAEAIFHGAWHDAGRPDAPSWHRAGRLSDLCA